MKGEGFKGTGDDYTRKQQAREERKEVFVNVIRHHKKTISFINNNKQYKK
jgi:hypothetical protein